MFKPNPGHEEEYESYLEDQAEWIREDLMVMLGDSADQWKMDGATLTLAGAFCTVDSPVEVYAAKLTLEAPAIKMVADIEAVGYMTHDNIAHCAVAGEVRVEGAERKYLGRRAAVERDLGKNIYEAMNTYVAVFLVDAMFGLVES